MGRGCFSLTPRIKKRPGVEGVTYFPRSHDVHLVKSECRLHAKGRQVPTLPYFPALQPPFYLQAALLHAPRGQNTSRALGEGAANTMRRNMKGV